MLFTLSDAVSRPEDISKTFQTYDVFRHLQRADITKSSVWSAMLFTGSLTISQPGYERYCCAVIILRRPCRLCRSRHDAKGRPTAHLSRAMRYSANRDTKDCQSLGQSDKAYWTLFHDASGFCDTSSGWPVKNGSSFPHSAVMYLLWHCLQVIKGCSAQSLIRQSCSNSTRLPSHAGQVASIARFPLISALYMNRTE